MLSFPSHPSVLPLTDTGTGWDVVPACFLFPGPWGWLGGEQNLLTPPARSGSPILPSAWPQRPEQAEMQLLGGDFGGVFTGCG